MNKTKELIDTLTERNKNALGFLKESINQDSYDRWREKYDSLYNDSQRIGTENYKKYTPHRRGDGSIPQEIRTSEEYQEDQGRYNKADNMFKFYNKNSPKDYIKKRQKEKRQERKAKWNK